MYKSRYLITKKQVYYTNFDSKLAFLKNLAYLTTVILPNNS